MHAYNVTAASIWFDTWRVVDPDLQNFDFSRQISEKCRIFQAISHKISCFPGKFLKDFDFSGNLKKSIFHAKFAYLQLLLGKLFYFYFSSKVTSFEHTSCT